MSEYISNENALKIVKWFDDLWIASVEFRRDEELEINIHYTQDIEMDDADYNLMVWVDVPVSGLEDVSHDLIQSGADWKALLALAKEFHVQISIEQDGEEIFEGLLNDLL